VPVFTGNDGTEFFPSEQPALIKVVMVEVCDNIPPGPDIFEIEVQVGIDAHCMMWILMNQIFFGDAGGVPFKNPQALFNFIWERGGTV